MQVNDSIHTWHPEHRQAFVNMVKIAHRLGLMSTSGNKEKRHA